MRCLILILMQLAVGPCLGNSASIAGLESFIQEQMLKGKIPGLSAVVLKGDQVLWDGHYGSSLPNISGGPKITNTTIFEVASVSKTIIGMAMMVLHDRRLVSVTDDINRHLPFHVRNPWFPRHTLTIHGLLTHTSSIWDRHYDTVPMEHLYFEGDAPMSLASFSKAMFSEDGKWYSKKSFGQKKPHTHHKYSNVASTLAAYIIEVIAIKNGLASSYSDFVRSHVLAPLSIMKAGYMVSDFGGLDSLAPPVGALPSMYNNRHGKFESYCFYSFPDYPDGAFKSSALDYARLFGSFIHGGSFQGTHLLKPATVSYMKKRVSAPCRQPCGGSPPQGNAFFYFKEQAGRTLLGHNGGEMGIATEAFYNPETAVGYVVFTNGDWGASKTNPFSKAFGAIEEKLLETFDIEASTTVLAPTQHANEKKGDPLQPKKMKHQGSGCPCGLPC